MKAKFRDQSLDKQNSESKIKEGLQHWCRNGDLRRKAQKKEEKSSELIDWVFNRWGEPHRRRE